MSWSPWKKTLMILASASALTGVLMNFDFPSLEAGLYDLRMSRGPQYGADSRIALITLDDETLQSLDEFTPLSIDFHARFLEALEKHGPKAVGYLVDMNQVAQSNPEIFATEWTGHFIQTVKRLEKQGTPVILGTPFDVIGEVVPPYPLSALSHSVAIIHKDGNVFGEDKITRRALLELNGAPSLHLRIAQEAGLLSPGSLPRGTFDVPGTNGKYFFFHYHGDTSRIPYPRFSFLDVLKGKVPAGALRDKLVLVGTLSRENSSDFAFTPYSKEPFTHSKIGIHAQILDSVIHGQGIVRLPNYVSWLTTFFATLFVLGWVLKSTPLNGLFATLGLTIVFVGASHLLFYRGIWIHETQTLIGIFLGYYLAVPYRLIREYQKRWDFQKKHQLLTQVEELKTNFLNLVTHDLKTPVARIQGLAEVLLRKAGDRLVDRDKTSLHQIVDSTDELNRFISRILELSSLESGRLQIFPESKDINQLIERSLETFKAPARAKQIKIRASLEPLFPVRIDVSLISKVINNLLDNALKYSPPGSEILVESRETGDWIEISVRDQGIGLSEKERESLFTRFYRAKNPATAGISGTGLGLYLTRYFIQAHQGRVEVESEPGRGSVFRILLPLSPQPGLTTASAGENKVCSEYSL